MADKRFLERTLRFMQYQQELLKSKQYSALKREIDNKIEWLESKLKGHPI